MCKMVTRFIIQTMTNLVLVILLSFRILRLVAVYLSTVLFDAGS